MTKTLPNKILESYQKENQIKHLEVSLEEVKEHEFDEDCEYCVKNSQWHIEKIKSSSISIEQAEKDTLDFFQKHIKQHKSPLCGSTVSHDRRFLIKYMPKLANHFHYRHLDVSSFKEVVKRWYPEEEEFEKKGSHRAMDDIKESVNELKFYREKFFK